VASSTGIAVGHLAWSDCLHQIGCLARRDRVGDISGCGMGGSALSPLAESSHAGVA